MDIALATYWKLPDLDYDERPFVRALRERGLRVQIVCWDNADFDWSSVRCCILRNPWDYMQRIDEFMAWAERAAKLTQLIHPIEIVRWNTRKTYLRDLESRGIPIVPTVWLDQGNPVDLRSIMRERRWQRGFIKPVVGATARETLRFGLDDLSAAQQHVDRLLVSEDVMIQPYLDSVETQGEFSAIFIDGQCTHTIRKMPVAGDYRVQDDFGGVEERTTFTDSELAMAQHAVEAVGHPLLYARADYLRDSQGELRMIELEIVEPSLFFRHCPDAAARLAAAVERELASTSV